MERKLRKWHPNLIEDFPGHWRKALHNHIESVDGPVYKVRSHRSDHVHSVDREARTCTCRWGQYRLPGEARSGCSHVVTAATHWCNQNSWRVQLVPARVDKYRENVDSGKGEADGQFPLGHGAKLLLYKIPKGYIIDQLEGMKEEAPMYRPDTVEDLTSLQERLKAAKAEHGNQSLEARRLHARVTALELYENQNPQAVPMDFKSGLSKTDEAVAAMGSDNTDIWIEEPFPETDDPDIFGDDHRPLVWAKSYLKWEFSVGKLIMRDGYPKHPIEGWRQYLDMPPSTDQVEEWWGEDDQDGRICIFTGYGGLYVFDFNETELRRRWQAALLAKMSLLDLERTYGKEIPRLGVVLTGGGGYHVYVKTENPLPGGVRLAEGVKGYGSGGLMVAPPSKHESGGRYQWATEYARIAKVPAHIFDLMLDAARELDA